MGAGTSLLVADLASEPARGLVQVLGHVQRSVPSLLEMNGGLLAATGSLRTICSELQDATDGMASAAGAAPHLDKLMEELGAIADAATAAGGAVVARSKQQQPGTAATKLARRIWPVVLPS